MRIIAILPFMRKTKIRTLVEHLFTAAGRPLSIQGVFHDVRQAHSRAAYSTVFRIVMKLQEEGKLHAVDWKERGGRYEWADMPHHHHIVCQLCGAVADLEDGDVNFSDAKIAKKTGFSVQHHSIELEGICTDCNLLP